MEFKIPAPLANLKADRRRSDVSSMNGDDQAAEFGDLPEPRTL
jgi:hypothetical protein